MTEPGDVSPAAPGYGEPPAPPVAPGHGPQPAAVSTQPRPAGLSQYAIGQLRVAGSVVLALGVVGALLGVLWSAWSPPIPAGENLTGGLLRDEKEGFMAADARFALITAVVGLLAALAVWFIRSARGPLMALGLAVGGLVGAYLTGVVGTVIRGGSDVAPVGTVINHLELEVQMKGAYFFEAAVGVLVYSLLVAFAHADDLGHPDGAREALHEQRRTVAQSVAAQGGVQNAQGYGDGPGLAQQDDFPAQEPH